MWGAESSVAELKRTLETIKNRIDTAENRLSEVDGTIKNALIIWKQKTKRLKHRRERNVIDRVQK